MSFTWSFKGKRSQFYQFGFIINAISKPLEEFLSSCQAFFWGGGRGVGRREGPQKLLRHQPYTFTCRTYVMWVCNNHTVLIPMEVKFIQDSIQDVAVFFSGPRVALILFQSNRLYGALHQLNTRQPGSILIPLHPGRVQNSFTFNLLTRKSD